jgi:sugar phosphate isomerase/epimerase
LKGKEKMKSCVSLYSYWKPVRLGEMDQYEVIEKIKALGVDAVELLMLADAVPKGETMQSYAKKLYGHARKTGLEVPILSMDSKLYCADPEKELSYLCSMVDVASECGIGLMRFDIAYSLMGNEEVKNYKTVINAVTPYIRRLADYAKGKGVKVISENHGRIIQDSYRIEELVTTVDHRNYGYLCDIGNFLCADSDPLYSVAIAAPYTFHAHVKDFLFKEAALGKPEGFIETKSGNFLRGTILGHGIVPVKECIGLLKKAGYDGWVSLEFEGLEDNMKALEMGYRYLKAAIEK